MVLQAKEIMDPNFLAVDEGIDALACARRMVAARKGYAVLTRPGTATIAGIVTEWDYLEKIVAQARRPEETPVRSIATAEVQSCAPDTPTDEVATAMGSLGIRRMVVRSGDQVVGVISSRQVISIFRQYVDRLTAQIAGYQVGANPPG